MDGAYLSGLIGLAGAAIGGLSSFGTTWLSQRSTARETLRKESQAVRQTLYTEFISEASRLFGDAIGGLSMSSTKSAIGHLLGGAGAVESIFCILAMRDQIVPPTLNLENPSVETIVDLVPLKARQRTIDVALSNSFGFGGTNASVIFARAN